MATKLYKVFTSCSTVPILRSFLPSSSAPSNCVLCHTGGSKYSLFPANWSPRPFASRKMSSAGTDGAIVNPECKAETSSGSEIGEVKSEDQKPELSKSECEGSQTNQIDTTISERKSSGRVPRMKAAILMSYSGQGYHGMQIQNDGTRTIENDVMKALREAAAVDEDGFQKPKSIKFQRAARTDKNVSAARQIISVMVPKTFDVEEVNKFLPDQIRFMDHRKVTKGFDAKLACNARSYLYMIPTFAFTPLEQPATEDYRITPEVLETLRETLKLYQGTKNFHNFTSRKKPTDPSAMRFIMSFTTTDPFVKDGLEYIVIKVKGQSFMLHQIRKMIGLAVAVLRGYASEETIKKAFTLDRIDIPMAPGLGLMLGEAHYDHYNKKFGSDGIHEPLIWDNVADKVEEFCQSKIYTNVTKTENEEKNMMQWLSTIPFHTYDIRESDGAEKGFGPEGKAHLLVRKLNGESDEGEMSDEDEDDDSVAPNKKRRCN